MEVTRTRGVQEVKTVAMGKIQRTRQLSRQKVKNPARQGKQPAPPSGGNPVLNLLQKHALLLFVALWAGMLGVAISAGKMLIHSEPEVESSSTAGVEESIEAADTQDAGKLPVLLFGAIALTCAAGSWMILQQLHSPKPRRPVRPPKPKQRPNSQQLPSSESRRQPPQPPRREIPAWGTQQQSRRPKPPAIKPLAPDKMEMGRSSPNQRSGEWSDRMDA